MVSFYPKFIHEKFHFRGGGIFSAKNRIFCVILTTKSSLDISQMCVETKKIRILHRPGGELTQTLHLSYQYTRTLNPTQCQD